MMLCKADFEELFPELFEQPRRTPALPSADCVARWEDDGGAPAVMNRTATSRPWPAQAAAPMVAAVFGLAAIHSAMQFGKVAMPPARRMLDVVETR